MYQDGLAPRHRAAVVGRQIPSTNTLSTSTTPVRTSPITLQSTGVLATPLPHAAVSTVTDDINLGPSTCTAALQSGGIIAFNDTYTLYLEDTVPYIAPCGNYSPFVFDSGNTSVIESNEPFYASTSPQVYALGAATVIGYILVILICITPRTFYVGGLGGSTGSAGAGAGLRTLLPGGSGRNSSVVGIGRRPLLQKIAALTVAISLTIATADTFRVAARQYDYGYQDSKSLVQEVMGSKEIRITRVISDTFLWLAQVQTLIRLFPRHKEKVTIKWLGFGLVLCDTVFSGLENFLSSGYRTRPYSFTDAIPALSYLFELSISLIYASCVLYYSLSKRRFAFWHAKMRNVCLVALLSIVAVVIPVVFFILDLAQPDIATWGEYIRWVGAAAASVVVWEWVERIEALERDEKKDGILGREIFDGDEMLDLTPSEDDSNQSQTGRSGQQGEKKRSQFWKNVKELNVNIQPRIPLKKWKGRKATGDNQEPINAAKRGPVKTSVNPIARPPQVATPISRSDTNSAASTVYAVRYHDPFSPSPAIPEDRAIDARRESAPVIVLPAISDESTLTNSTSTSMEQKNPSQIERGQAVSTGRQVWQGVSNPFKRKRTEPPAEVAAQIADSNARRSPIDGQLNLKGKFNAFTAAQKAKLGGRAKKNRTPLAVTFIPAQPRASQANIKSEATEAEAGAAAVSHEDSEVSDTSSESAAGSPALASLPVTVIPAPIKGGRTWSPDDMVQSEQSAPPVQTSNPPNFRFSQQTPTSTHNAESSPAFVQSQRGMLTISEPPDRVRDVNTPGNSASGVARRSRNSRSATLTSISDRLGSVSPAALSESPGPRSATNDPGGPSRSATIDSTGRQTPGG